MGFRKVEATSSRPSTRDSQSGQENPENPTAPFEIDWQEPCADCGHARMYHRRTPAAGASNAGSRVRRPTPFEILEGFVPPWRQVHQLGRSNIPGETLYYN